MQIILSKFLCLITFLYTLGGRMLFAHVILYEERGMNVISSKIIMCAYICMELVTNK